METNLYAQINTLGVLTFGMDSSAVRLRTLPLRAVL